MCLAAVHATSAETDEAQTFFKVAIEHRGKYWTPVTKHCLEIGVTRVAQGATSRLERKQHLQTHDGTKYAAGFHAFTCREDAESLAGRYQSACNVSGRVGWRFVVLEVRVRGIHTIGMDGGMLTVVAKEITPLRVLEPVEECVLVG